MRNIWLLIFLMAKVLAVTSSPIRVESFPKIKVDQATLIKGGKFFAARCMSCHSLKLFTHDPIGVASGVVVDKMPVFAADSWDGRPPPDLSLVAKYKGVDWVYTYLLSFYVDETRPTGVNNLLMPNTVMLNPYTDLQGVQVLAVDAKTLKLWQDLSGDDKKPWYSALKLVKAGEVPHANFNDDIEALVAFLDYVSEPKKQQRLDLAPWVLTFLAVLFGLTFFLKQEYWQDIDKH